MGACDVGLLSAHAPGVVGATDTLESMCGRYATSASPQDLMEEFEVDDLFDGLPGPDYNVAPTVAVPAIFERRVEGHRRDPAPARSTGLGAGAVLGQGALRSARG